MLLSLTYFTINEDVDEEETEPDSIERRRRRRNVALISCPFFTKLLTHITQKTDRCVGSSHRLVVETEYENETRAERSGMETSRFDSR